MFDSSAQIVLGNIPPGVKPTEFYISQVHDKRTNKEPIAKLLVTSHTNKMISQQTDLQGGPATAINRYLNRNLPKNQSLTAVTMGIEDLHVRETALSNGNISGKVTLKASFGLPKNYGVAPLVTTQYAVNYVRSPTLSPQIEGYLRTLLKSSLTYFNNWMNENADTDPRLAKSVKFTLSDYSEKTEGDTIYYSPKRKLRWDDFQSRNISSNKYQALVMPGIGYIQDAKIINGVVHVHIAVKAYLPKSAAWSRSTGRDAYTLNHEQRHFDIVKIIAEQFKEKVKNADLQPDTYDAFLNMQYLDTMRDAHAMQKAYDKETSHGLNRVAQASWDEKIDKLLGLTR
ncbi:DUF922 domain-containing protein [Arcticibacter pallidicorallinus]|uniref:DUF922 domain-containing protein n=1 Tax=Arcticibacter pallidicorallinus TaxID=1259464 RepID=UPI000D06C4B4|nr:hypothetical protein [Arcticibacter pallidicorallinus]